MDMEDLDATPRVLRVVNPESSGDSACETSQIITEKGRRFSLRSISGSLSSIWGSESTSRSHTELSQDLSSRGCSSFSSLLTANRTNSLELQQRFPIDGEVRPFPSHSRAPISAIPSTHCTTQQRAQNKKIRPDGTDKHLVKPSVLRKQSKSPHPTRSTSHTTSRVIKRVISKVMASNNTLRNGIRVDDDDQTPGPPTTANGVIVPPPMYPGPFSPTVTNTRMLQGLPTNRTLRYYETPAPSPLDFISGESGHSTPDSSETGATSYTNLFAGGSANPNHYSQSPNPLQAPPPSFYGPPPSVSASARSLIRKGIMKVSDARVPVIAALNIETSTFTIFGQNAKYGATAYAIFDMSVDKQNALSTAPSVNDASVPAGPYRLLDNYPGNLANLEIQTSISGAGVNLVEIGVPKVTRLNVGNRWIYMVHVGVKENSLASRLSTSVRSKENKSLPISIIDQWLDVLKLDNRKKTEPVTVTVVVKYRHNFMPATTTLETRATCAIKLVSEHDPASALEAAKRGKARARDSQDFEQPASPSLSTDDLLRYMAIANTIVHGLDPGLNSIKLNSIERVADAIRPTVHGVDALRLIHDFREVFGFASDQYVGLDLANLEAYYRRLHANQDVATEPITFAHSLRQRAKTVVNKLSPPKMVKKSADRSVKGRPATPYVPSGEASTAL